MAERLLGKAALGFLVAVGVLAAAVNTVVDDQTIGLVGFGVFGLFGAATAAALQLMNERDRRGRRAR